VILRPASAGWLDLAMSCFGRLCNNSVQNEQLRRTALAAAKKAVSLDVGSAPAWTALGAIAVACKQPSLAQHACIKSLELGANNAVPWINLGALYLQYGDLELANKAFAMAQAIEPSLSRPWVGQAMLSELFPSQNRAVSDRETLDLFRHALELATHPQASPPFRICTSSKLC
jgi:superkiller protein 3